MNKEITFKEFNLSKDVLESISRKGFNTASEVQAKVIPIILEDNKDVIAVAQTGTGKTGAFGLPLIDMIKENNKTPKAIILAPTRELAIQVTKELQSYLNKKRLNILTVYGGASISNQIRDLRSGVDIVVGTPGRVVDMINRNALDLNQVKYFILDEADEMLNMGFIEDMEFILSKTNDNRRVYLFSATMPKKIKELASKYMKEKVIVEVKQQKSIHTELIDQIFYKVKHTEKTQALISIISSNKDFYGIIFCKTKSEVDRLTKELSDYYTVDCIHGDVTQNKRERILQLFRNMKINILVATDVAARGIDVTNLTHVVNHSLPQAIETYVHRIGRTGRAGNKGIAISLITPAEMRRLSELEKMTGFKIRKEELPVLKENPIKKKRSFSSNNSDSRDNNRGNFRRNNRGGGGDRSKNFKKKEFGNSSNTNKDERPQRNYSKQNSNRPKTDSTRDNKPQVYKKKPSTNTRYIKRR